MESTRKHGVRRGDILLLGDQTRTKMGDYDVRRGVDDKFDCPGCLYSHIDPELVRTHHKRQHKDLDEKPAKSRKHRRHSQASQASPEQSRNRVVGGF